MADYVRGELRELPWPFSKWLATHENNTYVQLGVFHELILGITQRGYVYIYSLYITYIINNYITKVSDIRLYVPSIIYMCALYNWMFDYIVVNP